MAEPRKIRWDIAALSMLAASIFVWLALISHDPADPVGSLAIPFDRLYQPDQAAYPANEELHNWCGYWGTLVSHLLLHALGLGAYFVAGLMMLSVVVMLQQKPWSSPLGRSIGWTLILLAVTTLPALLDIHPRLPTAIGAGGYLGALTSTWINRHFALAGGVLLTLSCLVSGLLLSTEYAVVRALGWMSFGSFSVIRRVRRSRKSYFADAVTGLPLSGLSDLPSTIVTHGEPSPPIRIRGKEVGSESIDLGSGTPEKSVRKKQTSAGTTMVTPVTPASVTGTVPPKTNAATSKTANRDPSEVDPEELAVPAPETASVQVREVEVGGEKIIARLDNPNNSGGPRVLNRNNKKAEIAESLAHLDDTRLPEGTEEYVLPGLDLLSASDEIDYEEQALEVRRKAKILEQTFADFNLNIRVVEIETGPVIAQYEIELEAGLRLSKITGLADDLAIALRVPSVRIVAPIPGKNTVGIEVPNETRQVVRMREVIEECGTSTKKLKIPLFLGKDVSGKGLTVDLASLPHLLIAGRTGTGKSVCLNSIITSILMTRRPDEVRMLMIDPKMVELSGYARLPHLMHPVVTDMRKAEAILAWAVDKMEERYALLARAGVRHITSYNQLGPEELEERLEPETPEEAEMIPDHLPFIVIVADEIADLMMTSGKEVEQHIIRLAQKSRAVGIHLILATQKPTVDVITGLIKSNLPARISFQVASRVDSRVVLDEMGADKLLGNGDMLFLWPGTSTLLRGQGTYLSDDEINAVVEHCSTGEQNFVNELVNLKIARAEDEEPIKPGALKKRDELYEAAIDVVIREGRGSCSLLQRALGIGYGRAARLIDFMAEDGIVGQYNGSQARDVILSLSDWDAMRGAPQEELPALPSKPSAKKNIVRGDSGWDTSPAHASAILDDDYEEEDEEEEEWEEDDIDDQCENED